MSHNLWAIEEGFCSAIGNIPHDYLSYSEENYVCKDKETGRGNNYE